MSINTDKVRSKGEKGLEKRREVAEICCLLSWIFACPSAGAVLCLSISPGVWWSWDELIQHSLSKSFLRHAEALKHTMVL